MPASFSILFALLIAVPGLLIPLYIMSRMYTVLADDRRAAAEKAFAGGTMVVMLLLMAFSVYAALEISGIINSLAASGAREQAELTWLGVYVPR